MNGLIIAGGSIDDKFASNLIKNGAFEAILAADSGVDFLYRNHITPDIIIGDFDSCDSEALSYYRELDQVAVSELNPEKDDTDLEHTVREAIRLRLDDITIVGCFGDRIDHVLGNISLLGIGLEYRVNITLMDAKNRVRMITEPLTLKKKNQFGDFVTLLAVGGPVEGLTLKGFKYELDNAILEPYTSLGVSNEITAAEASIIFTNGTLLVIEARD